VNKSINIFHKLINCVLNYLYCILLSTSLWNKGRYWSLCYILNSQCPCCFCPALCSLHLGWVMV